MKRVEEGLHSEFGEFCNDEHQEERQWDGAGDESVQERGRAGSRPPAFAIMLCYPAGHNQAAYLPSLSLNSFKCKMGMIIM